MRTNNEQEERLKNRDGWIYYDFASAKLPS